MSDSEESYASGEEQDVNNEEVAGSGEENEDDEAEESIAQDDEDDSPKKVAKKRKIESDSEEDEEEEEDDEEEEDSEEERRHKKTKKRGRGKRRRTARDFILEDAEVDSDDEEDDGDYGGDADDPFGVDPSERAEAERFLKEQEKLHERRRNKYADMTEEEMERYFQERHAAQVSTHKMMDDQVYDDITQNGLLPSTRDPNLWIVKVRMGEEKAVALQLMRKHFAYQTHEEASIPLQIKSVVVKEGLKGIIYIEAYKKSHVATAIEGIQSINPYQITMVPIKEMVDTLKVVKDIPSLKKGAYVRLKKTMFKDDLAQVDWVDVAQNRVNLRLLPRIDYSRLRGHLRGQDDKPLGTKKRRPIARLFDVEKIKEIGGDPTSDGDFLIFEGNSYRRGFLYKTFKLDQVIVDGVKPSLTELEIFQDSTDDLKKELESTTLRDRQHNFAPGDNIEVIEGELVNLRGKIQSIDGDKEPLTLNANEIRKFFKPGDHVKVISGRYEGDTGLIVRVEENYVIMISDVSNDELKVLPRDIQLGKDVSTGVDSMGKYQYQDLVNVDKETVGVITRLEREYFEILTTHGKVLRVKPQAIMGKRESKFAKAMDANKNTLTSGDHVRVVEGQFSGKRGELEEDRQGEIKHIYRSWAFVFSRKHTENGGIFVCKSNNLALVGAKVVNTAAPQAFTSNNAELLRSPQPYASPRNNGLASPAHSSSSFPTGGGHSVRGGNTPSGASSSHGFGQRGSGGGGFGGGGGGPRRDTSLIGKSVRIQKGPYKGYVGIVKDATDATVRVELHAKPITVNFDRSRVAEVGGGVPGGAMTVSGGKTPTAMSFGGGKTPMYGAGSNTPMYGGSMTPVHDGSRTPAYGSTTPAYDGSRTPVHSSAWDPNSNATPAHTSAALDDIDYDGPDSNFSVPTPGSMINPPATPGYTPDTPGQPYSSGPMTPGGAGSGMYSDYTAPSPFPRSAYESGPYSNAASPFPHTPGGPSAIPDNYLKNGDWCAVDLCVTVRRTYEDEELHNQEGVIRTTMDTNCDVYFDELDLDRSIPCEYLLPVKPDVGDVARIVYGEDVGLSGNVISLDGPEAVIKMDSGVRLIPINFLCKVT